MFSTIIMDENRFFDDGFIADSVVMDSDSDEALILNKKYSETYEELMKQEGNQLDAQHQYQRSWIQTVNLAIGAIALGVLIYKQK